MESGVVHGVEAYPGPPPRALVAIGNFDGVHRGHAAVLGRAVERARAAALRPLVLTFDPHPAEALGRGRPPMLTTLARKVELLRRLAPELAVVVEPFDLALSRLTPREFAERLLHRALGAAVVVVGDNFRFGHGRAGDLATLQALGAELGFSAGAEPIVADQRGPLSSTRVRSALAEGRVDEAEAILGRPHSVAGRVVPGQGLGRTIGVPTANLAELVESLPAHGVYACLVDVDRGSGPERARGVANLGVRPTLGAGLALEVHLFDWDADLYGATLRVHFAARLREERRFSGLDALRAQIAQDLVAARAAVAARAPLPGARGWA